MRHPGLMLGLALATCVAGAASPHVFSPRITAADFVALDRTLASDAFEGRGPGTPGEDRTVEYIKAQMQRIGLKPGNHGQWFQTVPMVETVADPATRVTLTVAGRPRTLAFGNDVVMGTTTGRTEVDIKDSPLVFVGYGVDAPEQQWNDYAGIDVKGKTVVMLVNDPGFHVHDDTLFEGRRMTYYGRWTYKYEEAARKGAAAAIIIHDTPGASYGWDVVRNSWSGAQYSLPAKDDPAPRLPAQGWITGDQAAKLFADAGLDLDALRIAANTRGFKAVPMKAALSVDLKSSIHEKQSRNVVGVLPGRTHPDEAVLYMAHWDHLGKHAGESGDNIYNGAVDNASGVAAILETAGRFAARQPRPARSVVFLAVTLEESGLLGSQYYAAHPVLPLARTVGVINYDALAPIGKARDLTVVGLGSSGLEDVLVRHARAAGLTVHGEARPEAGSYFRSDHFSFAKAGVPAMDIGTGVDLVDGGTTAGEAAARDYTTNRYHKPADEYDAKTWKLEGILQLLDAGYALGADLADGHAWPQWRPGNPFRAARERMMQSTH